MNVGQEAGQVVLYIVRERSELSHLIASQLPEMLYSRLADRVHVRIVDLKEEGGDFNQAGGEEVREYAGSAAELASLVRDAEIIVVHLAPVTKAVINAIPQLRLIACGRGGPTNVNTVYAASKGIPVVYTPGRNARAVAEFTIGLIISLLRHIHTGYCQMRANPLSCWSPQQRRSYLGKECSEVTLGVIGYGQIGREITQLARHLGMEILVFDPFIFPNNNDQGKETYWIRPVSLEELLSKADVVSVHARVTGAPVLGVEQFRLMKKSAYLINTARSGAIDYNALLDVLKEGKLAGAALDVFENEPLEMDSELTKLDNVLITPHIAGQTTGVAAHTVEMLADDIVTFVSDGTVKRAFV